MTSYSTLIETMHLSRTVFDLFPKFEKSHVTMTMPTQGTICNPNAKASHGKPVY